METTKTRGGKRTNAGRKPSGNRKQPITIYITPDVIAEHGKTELKNKIHLFLKSIKDATGTFNNN